MRRWRFRALYFVLLPLITIAAGILGYYTYLTASQLSKIGERTIAESTLLLVREKVDLIEQYVISSDNAVLRTINLERAGPSLRNDWRPVAEQVSPSVRAVVVLDQNEIIVADSVRANQGSRQQFLTDLSRSILPELKLSEVPIWRLKHLHTTVADRTYLISYKKVERSGIQYTVLLHHDVAYIIREEFTQLFSTEDAKDNFNVIDENNRRVYGPSLAQSGDYVMGHRFPTTLYNWRMQIAPKHAPLLETQERTKRLTEVALIISSLTIILLGSLFLLYAARQERRLNLLKSEFIANVSHELKTPLSVVRMFGEMLLTKRVKDEQKRTQYLEIICEESERLSSLIENVLDFSALERGKQKYELKKADIGKLVERAMETFRYRVEREGTDITIDVEPHIPELMLDEQAILLATINLLDNAMKYGNGSDIKLFVERRRDFVRVRVRDHGQGIPPEAHKRIFERFYRAVDGNEARGSGIGLALVKHIADAHGGRVWSENAESGGAIVGFAIPIPKQSHTVAETVPLEGA